MKWQYFTPGPESQRIFSRSMSVFPGGVNSPVRAFRGVGGSPIVIKRGHGAFLTDVDGREYIDFVLSWGPLVLGHASPPVVRALEQQLKRGASFGAPTAEELQLAEIITTSVPGVEAVRFVNSGTEAGLTAVRLARGVTGRKRILKFSGCYHGHADSLLATAGSGVATLGLPDSPGVLPELAAATLVAPFNDFAAVTDVVSEFGDSLAAILVEPVMGNAGLIPPKPGFLQHLRSQAAKCGALLVFDEVMTGWRVDPKGAANLYNVNPDLVLFGKVIGGGLPVGAVAGSRTIMAHLAPSGPVYQAGTLSGNPLAMTAGAATLTEWLNTDAFAVAATAAARFVEGCLNCAAQHGVSLQAKCIGTMFGLFLHDAEIHCYEDAQRVDKALYAQFFHRALEHGLYFPPSPFESCFTSSAHTSEVIDRALQAVAAVFGDLASS